MKPYVRRAILSGLLLVSLIPNARGVSMPISQGPPSSDPGTSPEQQSQVGAQSDAARALASQQQSVIDQLQAALSAGDISQGQYNKAIGAIYDQRLAALRGDLEEQGRPEAAAGVPVGIGSTNAPPPPGGTPFGANAPSAGATLLNPQGMRPPQGKIPPELEILAGPTARPSEPLQTGSRGSGYIPRNILALIPSLVEAAKAPDAPPALISLLNLLHAHVA